MEKIKEEKSKNHVIRELPESFNQINIVGLNESVNIVTSDKSKDVDFLLDKALKIYMKIRTGDEKNQDECQ